jgi:octaprenyl-diphosphate synthase
MASDERAQFRSRLCYSLVRDVLQQVEIELLEVKSVRFLCDYPWAAGKRLRPMVFLLCNFSVRLERMHAVTLDGREPRLAAAIELLHEASLVHDDLVDRSTLRRGVPAMQVLNGDGMALLIGDYMVFRGLKMILDVAETREDIALAKELTNTGLAIAQGEADQLDRYLHRREGDDRMSMKTYLDLIAKKTAAFFAGCAEAGAAVGGARADVRQIYREFGMSLGLLFQMVDDLMDVQGDAGAAKKNLRNNLNEGTVTLPMVHAWQLFPNDRDLAALSAGDLIAPRAQARLYRKLATRDVLALCAQTLTSHAAEATRQLQRLPPSIYRSGLADLLDYIERCPWGAFAPRTPPKRKRRVGAA